MRYATIDTETTGVGKKEGIVQVGIVVHENGRPVQRLNTYINPQRKIPVAAYRVHGIGYKQVRNAPTIKQAKPKILKTLRGCKTIVAHNAHFDVRMLKQNGVDLSKRRVVDTMQMAHPRYGRCKLEKLAGHLSISTKGQNFHSAYDDARITMACYEKLKKAGGAKPLSFNKAKKTKARKAGRSKKRVKRALF